MLLKYVAIFELSGGNMKNCYENVSPIGNASSTKCMKVEIFINLYIVLWWCMSVPVKMFLRENKLFELSVAL